MHVWSIAALLALHAADTTGVPTPPPANHYVVDEAAVLDPDDLHVIDSIAAGRAAAGLPVYVLTVQSRAAHDSSDATFESWSRRVFDSWRATRPHPERAALLLVSVDDHKGRIEAGPAWEPQQVASLQFVLDDAINPALEHNSLEQGIVVAAHEITWALKPAEVQPWLRDVLIALGVIAAGAAVLTVLRRRRASRPAAEVPQAMADVDPNLRASQRMQAISAARERSEKSAKTIGWIEPVPPEGDDDAKREPEA